MNMGRPPSRSAAQPLSCHPSNPFDDPAMARRALGYGSSELSQCSSDLGGYGDPEPIHYLRPPGDKAPDDAEVDQGDDLARIQTDAHDDEVDDEEEVEASWNEEEFEEEQSIYFKTAEERHEIQAEIQDLQRAVPRLKEDYEILDRLGTGACLSFLPINSAA